MIVFTARTDHSVVGGCSPIPGTRTRMRLRLALIVALLLAGPAHAQTRPAGSKPLTDKQAAAKVKQSDWEPRPDNTDENRDRRHTMRAVAVIESWWRMSTVGDDGDSFGLYQLRRPYHCCPAYAKRSTAFNADYYGAQQELFRFVSAYSPVYR